MKLYIKEFYKETEKTLFICREVTPLGAAYYVLYSLISKAYLRPVGRGFFTKTVNPYYYTKADLKDTIGKSNVIFKDDRVYPMRYCSTKFGGK